MFLLEYENMFLLIFLFQNLCFYNYGFVTIDYCDVTSSYIFVAKTWPKSSHGIKRYKNHFESVAVR